MKNLYSFLLLGLFASVMLFSQNQPDLNELLKRLDENHFGSIYDVFTESEVQILRAHFDQQNGVEPAVDMKSLGLMLYSPENTGIDFGNFDNGDPGIYNVLGPSGTADFDGAGAFNPVSGTYFVVDNAGNAYEVDPDTGIYTFLGVTNPAMPAGENFTGLEFDPTDNTLYALSTNGAGNSSLSTINTNTLDVDIKGNTGLTVGIALAIDLSGTAYAFDIDNDNAYTINKTNGSASLLGALNYDANFGQGFALARSTGNLYISAFNDGIFNSQLRHFDPATGNTTNMGGIGSTTPGGTLQFAWTGVRDDVLGVNDSSLFNFRFYPNPNNGILNLSASENIQSVKIFNVLGQEVVSLNVSGQGGQFDISRLSSGSYFLKAIVNGQTGTYKLIKR